MQRRKLDGISVEAKCFYSVFMKDRLYVYGEWHECRLLIVPPKLKGQFSHESVILLFAGLPPFL